MKATNPIIVLAISLTALVLGLTALGWDPLIFARVLGAIRSGPGVDVRTVWATAAEMSFLAITGAAAIFLLLRTRIYWAGLFVLGALSVALYVVLITRTEGISLDAMGPGAALLLVFAAGALARWVQLRALKRQLRFAFADSLPRAAIEKIARNPTLLSLEGQTRDITYLACGVRGLPELAASLRDDPKSFTRLLEQVLTPLMGQTLKQGGDIDRLTTDGFTAYWNAPLDDADHALHACEAGSGMMAAMVGVNEDLAAARARDGRALPTVEIGIGIATGAAIVGGFAGQGRLNYSVNGDAVRLAARLQSLSRSYGHAAIVAEETQANASRGLAFLEVDYFSQSEEEPPVRLYAMLDNRIARASPKIRALATFHAHIFQSLKARQWDKARALVEQCRRLSGACQTLYELYLTRIGDLESNPPGPDWDGAFHPIRE
jgi:adenylate cyclase